MSNFLLHICIFVCIYMYVYTYTQICIYEYLTLKNMKGGLWNTWTKQKYYLAGILHFSNVTNDKLLLTLKTLRNDHTNKTLRAQGHSAKEFTYNFPFARWVNAILDKGTSLLFASSLCHLVGYLGAVLKTLNYNGYSTFLYNMLTY